MPTEEVTTICSPMIAHLFNVIALAQLKKCGILKSYQSRRVNRSGNWLYDDDDEIFIIIIRNNQTQQT